MADRYQRCWHLSDPWPGRRRSFNRALARRTIASQSLGELSWYYLGRARRNPVHPADLDDI